MKTPDTLINAVVAYQNGRLEAFATVYEESYGYLHTCIFNILRNEDLTEDILQETYLEITKYIRQLKSPENFAQWAATIANRKCFAYLKKDKDILISEQSDAEGNAVDYFENISDDEGIIPENIIDNRAKVEIIRGIIDGLTDVQRACVIGVYYNGQKQEEIAIELGIPVNTVKSHLNRAKAKIKASVTETEKSQGIRLLSVVPFFLLFFSEEAKRCITGAMSQEVANASGINYVASVASRTANNATAHVATAMNSQQTASGITAFGSQQTASGTTAYGTQVATSAATAVGTQTVKSAAWIKILSIACGTLAVAGIGIGVALGVKSSKEDRKEPEKIEFELADASEELADNAIEESNLVEYDSAKPDAVESETEIASISKEEYFDIAADKFASFVDSHVDLQWKNIVISEVNNMPAMFVLGKGVLDSSDMTMSDFNVTLYLYNNDNIYSYDLGQWAENAYRLEDTSVTYDPSTNIFVSQSVDMYNDQIFVFSIGEDMKVTYYEYFNDCNGEGKKYEWSGALTSEAPSYYDYYGIYTYSIPYLCYIDGFNSTETQTDLSKELVYKNSMQGYYITCQDYTDVSRTETYGSFKEAYDAFKNNGYKVVY